MNNVQDHPTKSELTAFGLGKLNDDAAEPISEHLAVCAPCMATLAGLEDDTFIDLIERADKKKFPPTRAKNRHQAKMLHLIESRSILRIINVIARLN